MPKSLKKDLVEWETSRDLNVELKRAVRQMKGVGWVRKTVFVPQSDGSTRRVITRRDGTVEKDSVISPAETPARAARAATGLSQAQFAKLLGVSPRTLQEWEQGRKTPSGAAATLLRIASKRPDAIREAAV